MSPIKFPSNIVKPIREFLAKEEDRLQKRKDRLNKEDPYEDSQRLTDNAAADTDAAEQIGHERAEALKREVDRRLIQIRKALTQIKIGRYGICEKCGKMIDTDRLMVMPEATVCVDCEKKKEK
jgi:RNA polymerase-binding transcription factor DksA